MEKRTENFDRCGSQQSMELTSTQLEAIMTRAHITIECANLSCNDIFGRHRIKVHLRDLIEAKVTF